MPYEDQGKEYTVRSGYHFRKGGKGLSGSDRYHTEQESGYGDGFPQGKAGGQRIHGAGACSSFYENENGG